MNKEYIQKVHEASAIIEEAQNRLLEAVKDYFLNNPEHTVKVNVNCKNSNFGEIPEMFELSFKSGDVNIHVEFEICYTDSLLQPAIKYTINSSLKLPEYTITSSSLCLCISNLVTINALYNGKLDRKIFLHFEKSRPIAMFQTID